MQKGKWQRTFTKRFHWVRIWTQIAAEDAWSPIIDKSALFSYLLLSVLILFVLDGKEWWAAIMSSWHGLKAFVIAIPIWILYACVSALFKTNRKINDIGAWHGDKFIYHSPLHVWTGHISEADNGTTHIFSVKDAAINSLVEVVVNIDSPLERVKAQVVWPRGQNLFNWDVIHKDTRSSLRLPNDRVLALRTYAIPDTSPVTIRVYISSWEI